MTSIFDNETETQVQMRLIAYLDALKLQGWNITYTAIPNSTYTTSWMQKIKNKQMGLKPGLPDMFIIIEKTAFFIELKRAKKSVTSRKQKEWIEKINQAGIPAFIAKGWWEVKAIIDDITKKESINNLRIK